MLSLSPLPLNVLQNYAGGPAVQFKEFRGSLAFRLSHRPTHTLGDRAGVRQGERKLEYYGKPRARPPCSLCAQRIKSSKLRLTARHGGNAWTQVSHPDTKL